MFKGNLYSTTSLDMVRNMMGNYKIIIIGDCPDQMLVQTTGALIGSVLTPTYQAFEARMNNDIEAFNTIYYNHLQSKEVTNFLACIFRSLYNGINILFYAPSDEAALFFNELYMNIFTRFGIIVGNENQQFGFDPNFTWIVSSILYLFELFSVEELMLNYPEKIQFADDVVMKLITETSIYTEQTDFESYRNYFYNYKERIKSNNNNYLQSIIQRG